MPGIRLSALIAVIAISTCLCQARELAVNGGFEQGLSGFRGHVNAIPDKNEPHTGAQCGRLEGDAERNSYVQQDVRVEGGRTYRYSVWVRCRDVPAGADAKAYYNAFSGDRLLGSLAPLPRVSGTHGWRHQTVDITMPEGADKCCLILQLYKSTGTVWFDDLSLVRLLTPEERGVRDAQRDAQHTSADVACRRAEQAVEIKPGARFLEDTTTGELFLICGRTAYTFGPGHDGFPLRSLVDVPTRTEFIAPGGSGALFRIELRPRAKYAYGATVLEPGPASHRVEQSDGATRLVFQYEERDGVHVTVTVSAGDDGLARWRMRVRVPGGSGLWLVDFPRLDRLGAEGDRDAEYLAFPSQQGRIETNPRGSLAYTEGWSDYPGGGKTMQFEAYCAVSRQCGLYVATEDPRMFRKSTSYVGKRDWLAQFVRHYPEQMGRCAEYDQPYPVALGTFSGDWYDACQLYRRWALQQPWSRRGPVAERADIPDWMRAIGAWCQGDMPGVSREDMEPQVQRVARFAQTVQAPVAFHAYIWQDSGKHDADYPILNPKPGFAQAVRDIQTKGVHVIPYINVYSADARGPAWNDLGLVALKLQTASGGAYSDMKHLVPMCPATKRWQQIIRGECRKLMAELPVDGLYLDQLTGAPFICFDGNHGHPVGGGTHFADGMRRVGLEALAAVKERCPDGITFGENCNEIYNDVVAAHLTWHEMNVATVAPMFPAVYADHVIRLGSFIGRPDTWGDAQGYYSKLGLSFTWGEQLGWITFGVLSNFENPELAPLRDYLRDLAKTRVAALDFLCYGQMLRPLALDVPKLPVAWNDWSATRRGMLPAVLAKAWRAPDGRVAVALCNWTGQERHVSMPVETDWLAGKPRLLRVCRAGEWSEAGQCDGNSVPITVAAHTALVVELAPAHKQAPSD